MSTTREILEKRTASRQKAREYADSILKFIFECVDNAPEELHSRVISMVMSELQSIAREMNKLEKSE